MNKFLLFIFLACASSVNGFSQPKTASSASSGSVTVFSDNGYYVKAKNSSTEKRYQFSFRYELVGYKVTQEAWSKFPVYTEVSRSSEVWDSFTLEANEERNVFTAPVAYDKQTEYYITITEVFNVREL